MFNFIPNIVSIGCVGKLGVFLTRGRTGLFFGVRDTLLTPCAICVRVVVFDTILIGGGGGSLYPLADILERSAYIYGLERGMDRW